MKVLVTGATGFIGNYVVMELLKNNHQVIATSSNEKKANDFSWFDKVQYIAFNLSQFDESINYFNFFNQPDAIIHLAWEGLPNYKSLFHFEENLPRHYVFIKNMVTNGASDITVTGTCLEYGMQEGVLSEQLPSMPDNSYALAKDSLRKFLEQLQKFIPFNFKWIRLFYMYGKGQNPNSLISQLEKAIEQHEQVFNMSGGEQMRDFLPVTVVAKYIVDTALQQQLTGVINCCSGIPIKVKQFVEQYLKEKKLGIQLNLGYYEYPDFEPMSFWGDTKRLNTIISND